MWQRHTSMPMLPVAHCRRIRLLSAYAVRSRRIRVQRIVRSCCGCWGVCFLLESGLRRSRRNVPQQTRILQLHRLIFCSHILFSHSFFNRRVRRDPRDSSLPVVKRASRNKTHPASTLSEHLKARERPPQPLHAWTPFSFSRR